MDLALRAIAEDDDGPSLSSYVERHADLGQVTEFLIHRSAYQLKEADPHSWALPRLSGPPKAALVEIQADEYGGGRPSGSTRRCSPAPWRRSASTPRPGAYLDAIPGYTLATVNLMSLFGLHRRLRGAIVGHLALFEMTSSIPNRRYATGLRRLGLGEDVTAFFDEHVEADAVHENIAAVDLAGGLARQEPRLGPRHPLGRPRARRARRPLGRERAGRLGGRRVLAAARRSRAWRPRRTAAAPALEPRGGPEVGQLVGAVAERPDPRAPAAAERHRLALDDDLAAVHVLDAHRAADDQRTVAVGGDGDRVWGARRGQVMG